MKCTLLIALILTVATGLSAQSNYEVMLNRPDITGLTGGGTTNLDGIPTTGLAVGTIIIVYDGSESRIYRLTAGTDVENPPAVIRPDDFNATTNAKVWKVRISSDPAETGHGGGGGTGWSLTGNSGTDTSTNFIGTTDNQPLVIRTNNTKKVIITQKGQLEIKNTGNSVFIGSEAGKNDDLSGNANVFIGDLAGRDNTTGDYNIAIGLNAFFQNTTGARNIACGTAAIGSNTTGNDNTGIGYWSLLNNTTGSANTTIGSNAEVGSGALINATALGYNASVNASNKVRIGNTTVSVIEGQVAWSYPSDGRFKFNVKDNVKGLDFILKLHPITYQFDTKKFDDFLTKNFPDSIRKRRMKYSDYEKSSSIIHTGFIAQEVEKAAEECGFQFDGVHIPENDDDNYSIAYSQFVVPLVKAVQEQQKIIDELKKNVDSLIKQNKNLTKQIQQLEHKYNKELSK